MKKKKIFKISVIGPLMIVFYIIISCSSHPSSIIQEKLSITNIDTNVVLVTFLYPECNPCQQLLKNPAYQKCKLKKIELDIQHDSISKLFGQALWNTNFPTVYVITKNYDILGIMQGNQFYEQADSILSFNKQFEDIHMEEFYNIHKDSILSLLSLSLKATRHYVLKDYQRAKELARQSLNKGSFFFNNYLLYKIYQQENNHDSTQHYKTILLNNNNEINHYIYPDLIQELHENN